MADRMGGVDCSHSLSTGPLVMKQEAFVVHHLKMQRSSVELAMDAQLSEGE
jgi:hypothetical protein